MQTNKVASLFVIKQDNTLLGIVLAEVTRQAVERGDKSIANIIESQVPTVTTTAPLTQLIRLLTKWPWPIPVVDKENKLQGMVVSNQVLMALAKNGD
jgi:glycine betaine/proline transport system ATP-binding protein